MTRSSHTAAGRRTLRTSQAVLRSRPGLSATDDATRCASHLTRLSLVAADLRRSAGSLGYGLVAQILSAATNLGLLVIAARVLGPAGLGAVSVGFAAYLLLLGFERGLLTEPLIATSSAKGALARVATARLAVTVALAALIPASALLAAIGVVLPARVGLGTLLFAPWVAAALVQDLGRSILFRDRSGPSVVLSDATWLLAMAMTAPIAFKTHSDWAVTGCWGAGAVAAAAVALWQIRWTPAPLKGALGWWRSEAWPFGRWLLGGGALYGAVSYASVIALVGILGAMEFGGLRAVQSVFAPLTLLGPAIALPGFPLVSRTLTVSTRWALTVAAALGGVITLVTAAYLVILYAFPGVLGIVFGHEFDDFQSIVVPIGIGQLLLAPSLGLTLFLKAQQRGRTLVWLVTLNAVLLLAFSVVLGSYFGLEGAAWASAIAGAVSGIALMAALHRTMRGA